MIDIHCLGSGSSGNSYMIYDGSAALLIEAGLPKIKIIEGYFKYMDLYASAVTFKGITNIKHFYRCNIISAGNQFRIGTYIVMPFETEHDCNEPLGFLIYSTITKEKLLFATDTYYIPNIFRNLNIIMVECNYSETLMRERVERGLLNKSLAKRIQQSHFALENVKDFLQANDLSKVTAIYLLHLSSENSDAFLFKNEIQRLTGKLVLIAGR